MIYYTEKEFKLGQMARNTQEIGKIIRNMVKERGFLLTDRKENAILITEFQNELVKYY